MPCRAGRRPFRRFVFPAYRTRLDGKAAALRRVARISFGISTRTLTNKLRQLEKESLIEKEGLHYTMTKKGAALEEVMDAMRTYGKKYL